MISYEYKWFGGDLHGVVEGEDVARMCTTEQTAKLRVAELNLGSKPPVGHDWQWSDIAMNWSLVEKSKPNKKD